MTAILRRMGGPCTTSRVLLVSAFAALVALGCQRPPRTLDDYAIRDAEVYIVPIGPFSSEYLLSLIRYGEETLGLKMGVTPPLPFEAEVYDGVRRQLVSQGLVRLMADTYSGFGDDPDALWIGITHTDMYIAGTRFRFAFSHRVGRHHAVISSARMSREAQGDFAQVTEVHSGMRKMFAKTVALLHFDRELSDDPSSVLYGRVMGLDDLDRIDERSVYSDVLGAASR